jgi:hypothetical protein
LFTKNTVRYTLYQIKKVFVKMLEIWQSFVGYSVTACYWRRKENARDPAPTVQPK